MIIDPEKSGSSLNWKDADQDSPGGVTFDTKHSKKSRPRRRRLILKLFSRFICSLSVYWAFRSIWHSLKGDRHSRHALQSQPQFYTYQEGPPYDSFPSVELEQLFLSIPNNESALETSRAYATHPHLAGSSADFEDAKVMLKLFQSSFNVTSEGDLPIYPAGSPESRSATLGLTSPSDSNYNSPSAWIDVYYPIMNTPTNLSLQILGEGGEAIWTADLVEDGDERDPEAAKYKNAVPTFHGFSHDGDVAGQLIYANYGTKDDYENLVASGANLTGKIVLVRYGAIFRGLKILGAQELDAAGVIIYSDPRDDGAIIEENGYAPWPAGPSRNPTSVQRGSVQYLSVYPGDPTTPGYPAYENATRTEGGNIPKIPSLPLSWNNAKKLLQEIGHGNASAGILLNGQASARQVKLVNHVDTKLIPIWNTMASIPGHIRNEVVLIGCHRDAWVMGAADPTSGTVSLHEIIRGFSELTKKGWRPMRTILFASWDAEEYGLVGSTEYGEDFAHWISEHVVSYLNVDVSVSGSRWNIAASPSLAHLIWRTALDIPHPTVKEKTLWDARQDRGPFLNGVVDADSVASRDVGLAKRQAYEEFLSPLGSGSDFTVFLQRLGIASTDQGFGFTPSDAIYHYHSIYDSQKWQETYGDPGFHRHVAVAQHLGLMAFRLIDSIVLPLNTTQYALELDKYLDEVESLLPLEDMTEYPDFSSLRKEIKTLQEASVELDEEKAQAEQKLRELLSQLPDRTSVCRKRRFRRFTEWIKRIYGLRPSEQGPSLHAEETIKEIYANALHIDLDSEDDDLYSQLWPSHARSSSCGHAHMRNYHFPMRKFVKAAKRVQRANKKLMSFEGGFISEGGIKDREWYKHLGVAPGKRLGYGATTLPGVSEALTIDRNSTLAEYEAGRVAELIQKLTKHLSS